MRPAPAPARGGAIPTPSGGCGPGALEPRAARSRRRCSIARRALVKPGGRIAYVTCSVLAEENGEQVRAFLARHPDFAVVPPAEVADALGERAFLFRRAVLMSEEGLLMTPRRTDTDGFFVCGACAGHEGGASREGFR